MRASTLALLALIVLPTAAAQTWEGGVVSEPPDAADTYPAAALLAGSILDVDTLRGTHHVREDVDWFRFAAPTDTTGLWMVNPFHQSFDDLNAQVDSEFYLLDLTGGTHETANQSWGANIPWLRGLIRSGHEYALASGPFDIGLDWPASGDPQIVIGQPAARHTTGAYEFATTFYGLPRLEQTPDGDRRCVADAVPVSPPDEVDGYLWYQDLDRLGQDQGWRATALRVPLRARDGTLLDLSRLGFQIQANTVARVAVFVGDEMVLWRGVDREDPGNPYGGNQGSIIRVGELTSLIPAGTEEVVVMLGSTINQRNGDPSGCLSSAIDAWTVRQGEVVLMPIYGWAEVGEGGVTAEATQAGTLRVRIPVGARNQLSGIRVTDLDSGTSADVIGGLRWSGDAAADTAAVVLDGRYTPGQAVRLRIEPLGRVDPYREHQVMGRVERVVNAGTPAERDPEAASLTLSAFPNPAPPGPVTLSLTVSAPGPLAWRVVDALGRRLQTGHADVAAGPLVLPLDLSGLPPGVYHVRVADAAGRSAGHALTVVR